jgi:hypothetical protein
MPLTPALDDDHRSILDKIREQVNTKGHPLQVIAQEFARVVCFSLILKAEFIDRILETEKATLE